MTDSPAASSAHPADTPERQLEMLAPAVTRWQKAAGRNHLPWQSTQDPYRVWLSEIMLQQTQVATVIPYYQKFLERFPTVDSLATASLDEVMARWAGLGYYSRAKNLHACAIKVLQDWDGAFPTNREALETLPGIGRSTAAAIAAFCYGERSAIMDGNVRRVFCRFFGIGGDPTARETVTTLWKLAENALPSSSQIAAEPDSMSRYTQGLMDLGATVCTRRRPDCRRCPLSSQCTAFMTGRTETLPAPKAKRVRKEKEHHVLLVSCSNAILLCRKPDRGVWANMWSLPDANTESDLRAAWVDKAGASSQLEPMAAFTHELTHFRMIIRPWRIRISDRADFSLQDRDEDTVWAGPAELANYGIPAPIKPLIEGITRPCQLF